MKNVSLILALFTVIACGGNKFQSENAPALPSKIEEKKQETVDSVPVFSDAGTVAPTPVQNTSTVINEPPKAPPPSKAPRSFTLTVSKLKHDSLFKNCLTVLVQGKTYPIACNKDFGVIAPKIIPIPEDMMCVPLVMKMESFKPVDQADCIQKIQANRENHNCEYQKDAFRTAMHPDPMRFKTGILRQEADRIKVLGIDFEDNVDADFNDYRFDVTAGPEAYLLNKNTGLEVCHPL